jgi:hypothetical protein
MKSGGTLIAWPDLVLFIRWELSEAGFDTGGVHRNLKPSLHRGTDKDQVTFLLLFLVYTYLIC